MWYEHMINEAVQPVEEPLQVEDIRNFRYRSAYNLPESCCVICLIDFEEEESVMTLPSCNHYFHIDCCQQWFSNQSICPFCRTTVTNEDIARCRDLSEDEIL